MKIFQFSIFFDPDKRKNKDEKDDRQAKFLSGADNNPVCTVLANDEKHAAIFASRQIPDDYMKELELIEIAVRPF